MLFVWILNQTKYKTINDFYNNIPQKFLALRPKVSNEEKFTFIYTCEYMFIITTAHKHMHTHFITTYSYTHTYMHT